MAWHIVVDGEYVHISQDDRHGTITVKAEAEGYVVDLWNSVQTESLASCSATYDELETDEVDRC
jgi:hypothetical protein